MSVLRTFLSLFIIALTITVKAQDTNLPELISPARDTSFECGQTANLTDKLITWFNAAGNAVFSDNSGSYTIQSNITLNQAITIFNNSLDVLCGNKQKVDVTFTAVDASGNVSVPTTASFFTTDVTPPTYNTVPNVQYSCVEGIRDTLINWIKNKAGYIATDLCSNSVQWTTFTYAISSNGIDLISGGGNIASGPYPMIPDGICNWILRINFFVRDECGNVALTPATTTFSVIDNVAPVFVQKPVDTTVDCDNIPLVITPQIIDYCDRSVIPDLIISSTQSPDTSSCNHYNYVITRTWTATDECSNSSNHTQIITVRDTTSPSVEPRPEVEISCKTYTEYPDSLYIRYDDNCSFVFISFTDTLKVNGCTSIIERTYTLNDVCQNFSQYRQILKVKQDTPPILTKNAENKTFTCADQEDFNAQLILWIQQMGRAMGQPTCGPINSFAAVKNSYEPTDPTTYPGTPPSSLPSQVCPSPLRGFLRYLEVDFVYFDSCGNYIVSPAVFGVADTIAPVIINCQTSISVDANDGNCFTAVKIPVPVATDDCVESSSTITKRILATVTSSQPPGPESIVDDVFVKLGPFNPSTASPIADGTVLIRLSNLDIDDVSEYFNIYDEDGTFIGTTPVGVGECASTTMSLNLDKNKIQLWIQDGFIDLRFEPFEAPGIPVLSINNICNGSSIEVSISYEIDIANAIKKSYQIGSIEEIPINNQDTITAFFTSGNHSVKFFMEDCGRNRSVCEVMVNVQDITNPVITCPPNINSLLSAGFCQDTIALPINFMVTENCTGNRTYSQLSPISDEAASISFSLNNNTDKYEARNKQLIFNNVFPIRFHDSDVLLEITFLGDNNDAGEYFEILGPGGYKIGNTSLVSGAGCNTLSVTSFNIPVNLFNTWITNNTVTLLAVPFNGNDGINPCTSLTPGQTLDNISFLRGKLSYSDHSFTLRSTGATNINNVIIPNDVFTYNLILNGGKSNITIEASDMAGNKGSCSFEVNVRDALTPVARCKNAVVTLDPSGLVPTIITPELINNGSTDNCKILSLRTEPSEVTCAQANTDVMINLIATDEQGNSDTCSSLVKVKPFELKPTFSSGLCANDTLKLFANLPPASVPGTYTFWWNGPGNIEFFTENPAIPNADESYNGVYILTVTGFNGCVSVGSLTVNIKPLTNPVLTASEREVCQGSEVLLTTTNYSGNINYDWYQGIFPTGILLKTTQIPELLLEPITLDANFYYVIARGPDCSSNPSPLLKITLLEVPEAKVKDLFLSPCEGDNITLASSTNNSKFTYLWTGPDGYQSQGANPSTITNVGKENAGNYFLVVRNGKCVSDTASTRIEIFERPTQPQIIGPDIFCEGVVFSLVSIGSSNADKYEWYLNGTLFTPTLENNLTLTNAQSSLQGTWTVRTVIGNCISLLSPSKFVAIDAGSTIGVINSGPVCMGDSVTLEATFVPNATYSWSGPVPNIPSVYNPTVPGIPGDYAVTITSTTGCKNNANTNVGVISVPQITALSNDALPCMKSDNIITFKPSIFPPDLTLYSYSWKGPNGFMSNLKDPFITNLSGSERGIYTLVIFNGKCPSNEITTEVKFDIIPAQPVLNASPFYCEGDSIIIQSSVNLTNADYIWNTPLGLVFTKIPQLKIPNVNEKNGGTYSLIIASGNCGTDSSPLLEIKVRNKPDKPNIITNSPVCHGDTAILTSTNISGAQYLWKGLNLINQNSYQFIIPNANKSVSGVFEVQITVDGCTSGPSDKVAIVVKDSIVTPEFELSSLALCNNNLTGAELCLNAGSLQLGASYEIVNMANGQLLTQGPLACQFITDMSLFSEGPNFITAKATLDGCTSKSSRTLVINVNIPPSVKATAIEDDIVTCPNEIVKLISKDGPPFVSVKWTAISPNNIISDINAVSPSITGFDEGNNIIYLDYSVEGCPDFSRDTVNIYMEFAPVTAADEYLLTYGQEGIFNVTSNDRAPQLSKITLVTFPKNGTVTIDGNNIKFIPDPRFLETETFTYKICADLCEDLCDETTVTVRFDDEIVCKAPSIFTPNGDGINDYFIIPCLQTDQFPDNKVVIFNEWGGEVHYSAPYNNDWDGSYGGKELPAGTYFYIIDTGNGRKPINGFLILQR